MTTTDASLAPAPARRVVLADLALAAAATVVLWVPSALLVSRSMLFPYSIPFLCLTLAMPLLLTVRRTAPHVSATLIYAAALVHWAVPFTDLLFGSYLFGSGTLSLLLLPVDLTVLVALASVTVHGSPRAGYLALFGAFLGSLCVGLTVLAFTPDVGGGILAALGVLGLSVAVWAVARQLASRGHTDRIARERNAALDAERERYAQLAVATERTRIAREMHDIVAHSLSIVIAQADGGRYAAASDPKAAERALATIADMSRAALRDMRSILGVLRSDEGGDAAPLAPQPVSADVEELVAQVRDAGLPVSLTSIGVPRRLPPGVGLGIYRICQEALTNALKHAGPAARANVRLEWLSAALDLQIDDDGRGAAAGHGDGRGQGVVGMRERAAALGGTLDAGPRTGGGFRVHAVIPTPPVMPGTGEIPIVGLGVATPAPPAAAPEAARAPFAAAGVRTGPTGPAGPAGPTGPSAAPWPARDDRPAFGVPAPRPRDAARARAGRAPVDHPQQPQQQPAPQYPQAPYPAARPAPPGPEDSPTTPLTPWPYLDTRGDRR